MIPIAVIDKDTNRWHAIARRLRGAVLRVAAELTAEILESAHAIVFAEAPTGLLAIGKPMLVPMDDGLSSVGPHIVNPDRYLPSRQLIRQQLDAGTLGAPGLIRIHRWQPEALLVRDLDLVLWYFGTAPNVVYARDNDASTQVHLGFRGGGMALIDHARHLAGDRYYSLSLIGSTGAAYADDHANLQLLYQGGAARAIRGDEGVTQWTGIVQAFVDRLAGRTGAESYPTWTDVLAVRDAVARSLEGAK